MLKGKGLQSLTRTRKVIQNFGFLTMGKLLGDAFTFLFFIVLSQFFGEEGIGQYSFAMAFTGFFVVFADFGLYPFTIKELSRRIGSLEDYYSAIISLRLLLSVVILGVLIFIIPFLPFPWETKLIIVIIGAYQVISRLAEGFTAVFVAHEKMRLAGFLDALFKIITALVGIAVVLAGEQLIIVLAIMSIVALGQPFIICGMLARQYGLPELFASWSSLVRVLREAIPYAILTFLYHLSSRVDVVFLGFFLGMAEAGIYNAAYRIVFFFLFIPQLFGTAILPLASRTYLKSTEELKILYHKSLNLTILIGLPTASGIWLIAPDLIDLIYGKTFAESASILRLLAVLLFLVWLSRLIGMFLISCDRQIERTKTQWLVALLNVLGNLLLIPPFGIKGAAVAVLISEMTLLIFFAMQLRSVLGWPQIGSRLMMSSLATASFCLPLIFFSSLSLAIVIPVSVLLYFAVLVLFSEIRDNEIYTLINVFLKGDRNEINR